MPGGFWPHAGSEMRGVQGWGTVRAGLAEQPLPSCTMDTAGSVF